MTEKKHFLLAQQAEKSGEKCVGKQHTAKKAAATRGAFVKKKIISNKGKSSWRIVS